MELEFTVYYNIPESKIRSLFVLGRRVRGVYRTYFSQVVTDGINGILVLTEWSISSLRQPRYLGHYFILVLYNRLIQRYEIILGFDYISDSYYI